MAHKKGVGSSKNGRESESKRLGVKNIRRSNFAKLGILLFVSVERLIILEKMLVWKRDHYIICSY